MESMFGRQNNGNGIVVETDKGRGFLGNFQESETKVKPKTIWFKENILKIEKKIQVGKNTAKIRDEFLRCYSNVVAHGMAGRRKY